MTPHVLLLEDDPAIARTVVYALQRDGMRVTHCLLVQDARQQIALARPHVLVLDIGLPDGSGLDLCRSVRATSQVPILMLSAHDEELDRILGLEIGADDYVTKPFSPRELSARVRALLRRSAASATAPSAAPQASVFTVDGAGQRISLHGTTLDLTRREFGLLSRLLERPGHIHSRQSLLDAVWGSESDSTDRTVDTHIKTLRAKLQRVEPGRERIVTHRGMGYSIAAD